MGRMHGILLVIERPGPGIDDGPDARGGPLGLALIAVMGGWVLFRSADLHEAIGYFASLFGQDGVTEISFDMHDALNDRAIMTLVIGCVLAIAPRWPARWSAAILRARPSGHRAHFRATHFFHDHGRGRRLQPVPLLPFLIT